MCGGSVVSATGAVVREVVLELRPEGHVFEGAGVLRARTVPWEPFCLPLGEREAHRPRPRGCRSLAKLGLCHPPSLFDPPSLGHANTSLSCLAKKLTNKWP